MTDEELRRRLGDVEQAQEDVAVACAAVLGARADLHVSQMVELTSAVLASGLTGEITQAVDVAYLALNLIRMKAQALEEDE